MRDLQLESENISVGKRVAFPWMFRYVKVVNQNNLKCWNALDQSYAVVILIIFGTDLHLRLFRWKLRSSIKRVHWTLTPKIYFVYAEFQSASILLLKEFDLCRCVLFPITFLLVASTWKIYRMSTINGAFTISLPSRNFSDHLGRLFTAFHLIGSIQFMSMLTFIYGLRILRS